MRTWKKPCAANWRCWTKPGVWGLIKAHGTGATLDEAIDDYLDTSKEIADCIYQDNLPKDVDEKFSLLKFMKGRDGQNVLTIEKNL